MGPGYSSGYPGPFPVVGRLGTTSLGGLALASTVLNTLVWVFNFLSYGTTVRVELPSGI